MLLALEGSFQCCRSSNLMRGHWTRKKWRKEKQINNLHTLVSLYSHRSWHSSTLGKPCYCCWVWVKTGQGHTVLWIHRKHKHRLRSNANKRQEKTIRTENKQWTRRTRQTGSQLHVGSDIAMDVYAQFMGWLRRRGREWQRLSNGASKVPFDSNPQRGQNWGILKISVGQVCATRQSRVG